ncbi:hypothetical protein ACFZBU_35635 [Embleya sp. NPDC008237]|uniref:hypothetical protein n=1 Tax=Embleya sp. NPDC008237 TaxID=3363978 RepID=UPI0036EAD2C1
MKVTEPDTRTYLDAAGEEIAGAARTIHAVTRARAADPGEEPRPHRRPGHTTTAGADIATARLDRAQAELDDALRRLGDTRGTAA